MNSQNMTSKEALKLLLEGNRRFTSGVKSVEAFHSIFKMKELAENGQRPFAIVLTCADSRVSTESIFDCGLGNLFVIRVAGNIVAPSLLASIEFAAHGFETPLCIVMGHSKCGAISLSIDADKDESLMSSPNVRKLIRKIRPAVLEAKKTARVADARELVTEVTWANIRRSVRQIQEGSESLRGCVDEKKLLIAGALYDIGSGHVTFDLPKSYLPKLSEDYALKSIAI